MKKKKISIIIPFYNTEKDYIEKAIESAINQSYENVEVIVIDDGSAEDKSRFLEKKSFIGKIKVIRQENLGVSEARNQGIINSTGDWILFLDSDDWLEEDACSKFIEIDNLSKYDLILSKCFIHQNGKKEENNCTYESSHKIECKDELFCSIFKSGKYTCIDTPWAKLYKKEFLLKYKLLFDPKLRNGEDGLFNFEVFHNSENIYFFNEITYNYRVNQSSVCNTFYDDLDQRFIDLIYSYNRVFNKYNITYTIKYFDDYVLRIVCRLLRKYYYKLANYSDFKNKITIIIKDPLILFYLSSINYSEISFRRRLILFSLKNKCLLTLYFLKKLNFYVK